MADELLVCAVLALDDQRQRQQTHESLRQIVQRGGERRRQIARLLVTTPLENEDARVAATDLLRSCVPTTPEAKDAVLLATSDGHQSVRRAALIALSEIGGDPRVRECALRLSRDSDDGVRVAAVRLLGQGIFDEATESELVRHLQTDTSDAVRSTILAILPMLPEPDPGPPPAASSLRVIADPDQQIHVLELLDQLERAVHTLVDLGVDEGQERIANELILPSVSELRALLANPADNAAQLLRRRERAARLTESLNTAGKALTYVVLTGDAIETVRRTAQQLAPVAESLARLVTGH